MEKWPNKTYNLVRRCKQIYNLLERRRQCGDLECFITSFMLIANIHCCNEVNNMFFSPRNQCLDVCVFSDVCK